ncbi:MAG TPA: AMP-binding protein [Acidimicrobiales bacterium]|nr:AMP-binding protein [Acidimicrobiales bacterium]
MDPSLPGLDAASLAVLIRERAASRGDAPYLLDARSSRVLTYAALEGHVAAREHQFRRWGLERGERIGLAVGDPLTFAAWFLAAMTAGLWVAPLDPSSTQHVAAVLERGRALHLSAIVSEHEAPSAPSSFRWHHIDVDEFDADEDAELRGGAEAGGVVLSSSGTTGTPKVIPLSTLQVLSTARLIARHHRLDESDRGFNPLPLWHINAEVVGLLATLVAGASLVVDERFHRTEFWRLMEEFEVTWINAVPAIISRLATPSDHEVAPRRVRFVRSASAPLAPALFERFEAAWGLPILQTYGMTEAASQICATPVDGARKAGSVGIAVGVEVRVVAHGDRVAAGVVGDVEIKGSTVITSYESADYDDRFSHDGWLKTGDLGYLDDDAYLFLVGRDDDVINRGGEKIHPLEVELILAEVGGVQSVAVVASPDDVFGQVPVAFIQPDDESVLTSLTELAAIVERVRRCSFDALAKAQRPTFVKIVRALPVHATGKIRRSLLRQGDDVTIVYEERL